MRKDPSHDRQTDDEDLPSRILNYLLESIQPTVSFLAFVCEKDAATAAWYTCCFLISQSHDIHLDGTLSLQSSYCKLQVQVDQLPLGLLLIQTSFVAIPVWRGLQFWYATPPDMRDAETFIGRMALIAVLEGILLVYLQPQANEHPTLSSISVQVVNWPLVAYDWEQGFSWIPTFLQALIATGFFLLLVLLYSLDLGGSRGSRSSSSGRRPNNTTPRRRSLPSQFRSPCHDHAD